MIDNNVKCIVDKQNMAHFIRMKPMPIPNPFVFDYYITINLSEFIPNKLNKVYRAKYMPLIRGYVHITENDGLSRTVSDTSIELIADYFSIFC